MDEIGECGVVPAGAVAAGGDQPAKADAFEHDVQRQSIAVRLQYRSLTSFTVAPLSITTLGCASSERSMRDLVQGVDVDQDAIGWHQRGPRVTRCRHTDRKPACAGEMDDLDQVVDMLWIKGKLRLAARRAPPIFPDIILGMADVNRRGNFGCLDFLEQRCFCPVGCSWAALASFGFALKPEPLILRIILPRSQANNSTINSPHQS